MDKDLEKMLAVISGKSRQDFELGQVSDIDKKQLTFALETIFSGLTLLNWLAGGLLRDAWKKSVDQMRAMIFEIKDENPVVIYLRYSVFNPAAKWVSIMSASDSSGELIQCPADKYDDWLSHAHSQINEGVEIISQKISDFESGQSRVPLQNQSPENSQAVQAMIRSRMENEREHQRGERERTRK